jgi:hypothetical protein
MSDETPNFSIPLRRMTQAELDAFLEKAADILRGNVDHSEFRGYVFALLFFKRISDLFEEAVRKLAKQVGDELANDSAMQKKSLPFVVPLDSPTYLLDENYLTKLEDIDPDSKALDIEAMLAAELKIRADEDPQAEPLSEKLKRIIDAKRNGTLQGVALISALEKLAGEVVDLVNEGKRPISESIAHAAREINPGITEEKAAAVANAVIVEAGKVCFPKASWRNETLPRTKAGKAFPRNSSTGGPGRDLVDHVSRRGRSFWRSAQS